MKRIYLSVFLLVAACSCSHSPVGSAEHDLLVISKSYDSARAAEIVYDALPICILAQSVQYLCSDATVVGLIRTAGFNAEASLTIAEGERTDVAISNARSKVKEYAGSIP